MPAASWPLLNDRPMIDLAASSTVDGQEIVCRLIADTGAGSRQSVFELVLDERICIDCGGIQMGHVQLGGAFSGSFPVYLVQVRLPALTFDEPVPAVGVPQAPQGFDGIAGFKFLRRFHYGNFASADEFGLDPL